jgi:hypothetical protein
MSSLHMGTPVQSAGRPRAQDHSLGVSSSFLGWLLRPSPMSPPSSSSSTYGSSRSSRVMSALLHTLTGVYLPNTRVRAALDPNARSCHPGPAWLWGPPARRTGLPWAQRSTPTICSGHQCQKSPLSGPAGNAERPGRLARAALPPLVAGRGVSPPESDAATIARQPPSGILPSRGWGSC